MSWADCSASLSNVIMLCALRFMRDFLLSFIVSSCRLARHIGRTSSYIMMKPSIYSRSKSKSAA